MAPSRLVVVACAAAALALWGAAAPAAAAAGEPFGTATHRAEEDPRDARGTAPPSAAAMLRAPPLAWRGPDGPASRPQPERRAGVTPGRAPGGPAAPGAEAAAREEFPAAWKRAGGADGRGADVRGRAEGSPDVFTAYCANCDREEQTEAPQNAVGKLFVESPDGRPGYCSAAVISRHDIVVTAAHCCYDRDARAYTRRLVFVPAFRDGEGPYGTFPYDHSRVPAGWIATGDREDDVCLVRLRPNSRGRPVTFYTGFLGRAWDEPAVVSAHALGYPADREDGRRLRACAAETFAAPRSCGGDAILNMGCDMTEGASGGPWILRHRSDNLVDSVVSGYDGPRCTGTAGRTFNGPRFTSENIVPLCRAEGC